ncbi:hypothetical protein [Paludibaculum fermentans]|uniref:hypothetical protein n=1 Tax=Paludibaculum fermentans TaxID=1473598 RepID=UPI003EBCC85F
MSFIKAGQDRRGGRDSHKWQVTRSIRPIYRTIRMMKNIDVYIKVEVDLDESEHPQRFAEELCRVLKRVYGVRKAEVSNLLEHTAE